jgi:hypothetical protein
MVILMEVVGGQTTVPSPKITRKDIIDLSVGSTFQASMLLT